MAKRSVPPPPPSPPLRLLVAREEARSQLEERIHKASEIGERTIESEDALEVAKRDYRKWNDYNAELLRQIFSNSDPADEYSRTPSAFVIPLGRVPLYRKVQEHRDDVTEKVHRLQSLVERLEVIPLSEEISARLDQLPTPNVQSDGSPRVRRVFIVHGHDDSARERVARFLERLDFEAEILHEQPNEGRTLIDKLETHADVGSQSCC